jgi:type I restriction enzyme S subunit
MVREFPEGCFYPDLLIRLRFRTDCLLPEFAVMQWNEPKTHSRLLQKAKSTNGIWKVNGQDIKSHRLAAPPLTMQERFLEHLKTRAATVEALIGSVSDAVAVQRSLINTFLRDTP